EAWDKTANIVNSFIDETVQRWSSDMDALLVYAGLFSAILTAFNVQSYLLLVPATPDPIVLALQQVSSQISSLSVSPGPFFVNSTAPAIGLQDLVTLQPPRWAVILNAIWFSSLICGLTAALSALIVKNGCAAQMRIPGTSRQTARLRHHRFDALVQ
ncbi:hypothetical protein C8Q76DRAFT_590465, partial [Earliella scabrosa]